MPDNTVITSTIDSRILKVAGANKKLVATHHIAVSATEAAARWYVIDISGATAVLSDEGQVTAGNQTYSFYPGIDINSSGQIGMSYMRSGTDTTTDFISMYVAGRVPSDVAGRMEASVAVPAGAGTANYSDLSGGRAGDISGINIDPVDGSFWAANEYANTEAGANWGTAIANFSPSGATHFVVSAPSTATAGNAFNFTVIAKDASNNTVPLYGGTVHFTSTDGQAMLPADYTFQAADTGPGDHLDHRHKQLGHGECWERDALQREHSGERDSRQRVQLHGYGSGSVQQHRHGLCRDGALHE